MAVITLAGAAALVAAPVNGRCNVPVVEFVTHTFESGAGDHEHHRCQFESDRRAMAGLALGASGGVATLLLARRR